MTTVIATSKATTSGSSSDSDAPSVVIEPLGLPVTTKRSWFAKRVRRDGDAVATQPSVFDDPDTAEKYHPPESWENIHRFNPSARWTWGEELRLVRKIDFRIMLWTCIMFMALELDRANITQAVTDNFLADLRLTTNDYNLGNTVFKLAFLCAELPSQLVSKKLGPDRWIPLQMTLWSFVAGGQFWLSGRSSFLVCRALLGILQGGFIPDVILYLSYFYKHHELSIRLGFFWMAMSLADIASALLAYGFLHMRGVQGYAGWRWLFLLEGIMTAVVGILAALLMPAGPCQTASWFRGKKGWFTEREETIIVNRVLREDPSKSSMHNREPITPATLWQSLQDYDLWPLYILGLVFLIPTTTPQQYLTISLRNLGFDTFETNLLSIPWTVLHIIMMIGVTYLSEALGELTFTAILSQIWALPFIIYLNTVNTAEVNRWIIWAVITLLLGAPYTHPIQVGWNSRNSNGVRLRTVSAACYNMFVQAGGIISSNIYRADDAPNYHRGNRVLLGIVCMNIGLYCLTKVYYVWRNKSRDAKWTAMTQEERLRYLDSRQDDGNKRLDFRFQH